MHWRCYSAILQASYWDCHQDVGFSGRKGLLIIQDRGLLAFQAVCVCAMINVSPLLEYGMGCVVLGFIGSVVQERRSLWA